MVNIVRVNMSRNTVKFEPVPDNLRLDGGRSLTSRIISDEVLPECNPLGEKNKLIIAPGLLAGTTMSSASRLSIGAKSPLTGGIKESNGGGTTAFNLSQLKIKAIIIEGKSKVDYPQYLYISKGFAELRPAEFALDGIYNSAAFLQDRYGKKVSLILIGPAGERFFPSAGIANTDREGRPSRFCARGGLGAVMGSKGIKAIVVDPEGADRVDYHDKQLFRDTVKELIALLKSNPATGAIYPEYSTLAMADRTNALKGLPTRNFSQGSFEFVSFINGEYLNYLITSRGGDGVVAHSCMPGCVIRCSNVFADQAGKEIVAPMEYETVGLLGSNCGIGSLDAIARLNYICNDLGVDTIEMGATIGIMMEQKMIAFGDAYAAEKTLLEIKDNTLLGKVVAQGAFIAGKVFGSQRVPVVKGQAMAAYDPRAIKGFGVTYATSPMGADHTAGSTVRANVDHTDPNQKVELSLKAQKMSAMADYLGLCIFSLVALGGSLDKVANLLEGLVGGSWSEERFMNKASDIIKTERLYNVKAGFNSAHDRIPEYMTEEKLLDLDSVFDITNTELDRIFDS